MSVNVSARMARKSTVRDLSGKIIDLIDETDGGWIIRNRRVVNQEKYDRMVQAEKDRKEAAIAMTKAVSAPQEVVQQRAGVAPTSSVEVDVLKKKVEDMENKLDAILKAVQK